MSGERWLREALVDEFADYDGAVAFGVAGGEEEGDHPSTGAGSEACDYGRGNIGRQFGAVAVAEFGPLAGFVGEPFSQQSAGGDLTLPGVTGDFGGAFATRPDPVDKDAVAVGRGGGVVNLFRLHGHSVDIVCRARGSLL